MHDAVLRTPYRPRAGPPDSVSGSTPRSLGVERGSRGQVHRWAHRPRRESVVVMIRVEALSKKYGQFQAVDDVTFSARPGRVTGFLGPNGAGKSTTMRVMVGLTPPSHGTATILGRHYADLPNPGREVGVLLDASAQHAGRTGRETLRVAARTMGLPVSRVDAMLERVGLDPDRGRPPGPQLLPRHAPAARHRHRTARRARGTDPRRARQRPRPRGHPVDAGPAPRLRRPGRDRPAVLAPAARDRSDRRRPGRDRPGPDRRRGHQDRPALRRRARSSGAEPSPSWRAPSPSPE